MFPNLFLSFFSLCSNGDSLIMAFPKPFVLSLVSVAIFLLHAVTSGTKIPSTLDGPFEPVTVPFDANLRGNAVDLPESDPRVQRRVKGFEPEQISVSLSSHYDSVWISWITGESQIGYNIRPLDPKTVSSVVRYGNLRYPLIHEATGYSLVYSQLYPFEGLKPSTLYYYRCGDPSLPAMSKIYSFRTMPASHPRSYPDKIAVVGDLGLTYNTTTTISHLISNKPDLVLLVGDVTYANLYLTNGTGSDCYSCSFPQTPIHETYQPRWDYWGRFMQNLVSKVPIMVVEGNHEIEAQAGSQTFSAYSSRFAFPSEESGSSSTFYYSFNVGGIHFVMLGAYIAYNRSADQYKWLERDLASVDRSITPWLVAAWHPPWYSSYQAHYREVECMRVAMEELLYSYGVDIVFNGHVHAYERSNRVYNYTLDPCGPVYITVGDGGNREKMAIKHADDPGNCPDPLTTPDQYIGGFCATNFTSGPAAGKFCWDRQPEYSALRESSFGHGILEVKNETWALWTWYRNQDSYSEVGDQIYIVRQPSVCPVCQQIRTNWFAAS
ncbi:purple acid phosphatase 15 isoform X1 [Juglans microcarpa x Juglans regia]|uniref:purple acid phosphatase 15 isoform X1 n=1 Tax=Juglans microcarpa x Juglans regia TaxID=2249226 RepID=UPI001B7E3516|nr:purple acid phosphatase 15 isoform X1 [Juglans microcarpa x Juglans regia]